MPEEQSPKIIVDEDWKAQVEREREAARQKAEAGEEDAEKEPADAAAADEQASFSNLIMGLSVQAMMALGVIAPRDTREVHVDLAGAKYAIDMLMVLRAKTKGNLTPGEEGMLTQTLADLQHTFVVRSQQVQEAALRSAGIDLGPKP